MRLRVAQQVTLCACPGRSNLHRSQGGRRLALPIPDSGISLATQIVEPDKLFRRLVDGIVQEHLRPVASLWTGAVKRVLRTIAHEIDPLIVVYPNNACGGLLLDLIWLKPARDDADGNGKILLAVECEWGGSDAVWFDFSKLLYVRASLKSMVCDLSPKALEKAIHQFEQDIVDTGGLESYEKYVVINFGVEIAEYWWCEPLEPLRFQQGLRRGYRRRLREPLRRRRDQSLSFFRICFARFSLISECRGTGCDTPVRGIGNQSCLPPCRTNWQPVSWKRLTSSRRFKGE